jgi:hypothetical protein
MPSSSLGDGARKSIPAHRLVAILSLFLTGRYSWAIDRPTTIAACCAARRLRPGSIRLRLVAYVRTLNAKRLRDPSGLEAMSIARQHLTRDRHERSGFLIR